MSDIHQHDMVRLLESQGYSDLLLTIGPEKTRFNVHQNILCIQSPFFDKACSENSKTSSSSTQTIDMPAVDVKLMKSTLHYLYTGELDLQTSLSGLKELVEMSRLWNFLDMSSAQGVIVHQFHITLCYGFREYITVGDKSKLVSMIHDLYTYCGNDISTKCRGGLKSIVELLVEAMEEHTDQKASILQCFEEASGLHRKLWLDIIQSLAGRIVVRSTMEHTEENAENQPTVESKNGSKHDSHSSSELESEMTDQSILTPDQDQEL